MWITFDRTVLQSRVSVDELDAVGTFDNPTTDPVAQIIASVIAEIRTAVASCAKNKIDPDPNKIPASLVSDACSLASYYLATRAPGAAILSQDARYQAWAKARENLDSVRSCTVPVEDPFTGAVSPQGGFAAAQIIVDPADEPRFTRRKFNLL